MVLVGLHFANGLTLTEDETALIFAETDAYRLTRLELGGDSPVRSTVIADNLPGFPDNLSRLRGGRFWVALPNSRQAELDRAGKLPAWLRKGAWKKMDLAPPTEGTTWVMAFDETGKVVADLQCTRPDFFGATGVAEARGKLYAAAVDSPGLLEIDIGAIT